MVPISAPRCRECSGFGGVEVLPLAPELSLKPFIAPGEAGVALAPWLGDDIWQVM